MMFRPPGQAEYIHQEVAEGVAIRGRKGAKNLVKERHQRSRAPSLERQDKGRKSESIQGSK